MALALGISAYSLMEGVYLPEDLAKLAVKLGYGLWLPRRRHFFLKIQAIFPEVSR